MSSYRIILVLVAVLWAVAMTSAQDQIKLRNGEILKGVILAEDETSITIQSPRWTLTFPKDRVQEISRERREPELQVKGRETLEVLPARDDWFEVRNAKGELVGSYHRIVTSESSDAGVLLRLEEQWCFLQDERERLCVNFIEWASPRMVPVAFHYREWEGTEGSVSQGDVRNGQLELRSTDRKGKQRAERIPFPVGTLFPMLAQARLRNEVHTAPRRISLSIYDYLERQLVFGEFLVGELRKLDEARKVRVIGRLRHDVLSEEWLDGAGETVRQEFNGPDLVAKPATRESILSWLEEGGGEPEGGHVVEGGRNAFRIYLPDPSWEVLRALPEESTVVLRRKQSDLSATFIDLGDLPDKLTPEGAIVALERRVHDLEDYRRTKDLQEKRFGKYKGLQTAFQYRVPTGLRAGTISVVEASGKRIGMVVSGTHRSLREASMEIDRLAGRLEIQ